MILFQLFVGNKNVNCFNEKFLTVCDTLFPFLSSTRSSMAITNQANSCECRLIFEYIHAEYCSQSFYKVAFEFANSTNTFFLK